MHDEMIGVDAALRSCKELIAVYATVASVFALAQQLAWRHTECAFQASSPKTSMARSVRSGLFFVPALYAELDWKLVLAGVVFGDVSLKSTATVSVGLKCPDTMLS